MTSLLLSGPPGRVNSATVATHGWDVLHCSCIHKNSAERGTVFGFHMSSIWKPLHWSPSFYNVVTNHYGMYAQKNRKQMSVQCDLKPPSNLPVNSDSLRIQRWQIDAPLMVPGFWWTLQLPLHKCKNKPLNTNWFSLTSPAVWITDRHWSHLDILSTCSTNQRLMM